MPVTHMQILKVAAMASCSELLYPWRDLPGHLMTLLWYILRHGIAELVAMKLCMTMQLHVAMLRWLSSCPGTSCAPCLTRHVD